MAAPRVTALFQGSGLRIAAPFGLALAALGGGACAVAASWGGGAATAFVLLAGAAATVALGRRLDSLLAPGEGLRARIEQMARGERTSPMPVSALCPLATLAAALDPLEHSLEQARLRAARAAGVLHELPDRLAGALEEIEAASTMQTRDAQEASALFQTIRRSIEKIRSEVDGLSRASEEVSSSMLEMSSSIDEVARNAASLHEAVDTSTTSVHEMGSSMFQVEQSAEAMQRMAEETAASMTEMDRAIHEVSELGRETWTLTQQVSVGADEGTQAVSETITGIEEIRSLTRGARQALERLVERIGEIGEIVDVIRGINEETNLLSLNAAIIAAQAGEQGKAFAVVANHVKSLATRTGGSTQEIERLIRAVQEESGNAVRAMEAGIDSVETGVGRSRRAGSALETIRSSAREASTRAAEIARASVEQTKTSKHVSDAAQRTSAMVQQITTAIGEQSRASGQMLKAAEAALELCKQLHSSTSEQRDTARFITQSVCSMGDMIRAIQGNTTAHARASGSLAEVLARIADASAKSAQHLPELQDGIERLQASAAALASPDPEPGADAR